MLQYAGLSQLLSAIEVSNQPLGLDPAKDKTTILNAMASLNRFLAHGNLDMSENLYRIASLDISKSVSSRGRIYFSKPTNLLLPRS